LGGLEGDWSSELEADEPKILSRASEYAFSRKLILRFEDEEEFELFDDLFVDSAFGRFRIVTLAFPNIVS
jgi:hypothetical protein